MITTNNRIISRLRGNFINATKRNFASKPYITKDARRFVKDGKRIQVGLWLLTTSGIIFTLGTMGGFSRNLRFGMNKIQWRGKGSTPTNDKEWEEKYEDFKKYPEYTNTGKPITLEQFKQLWKMGKLGMILGPGTMFAHLLPMIYFLARGYIRGPMKKFLIFYSG